MGALRVKKRISNKKNQCREPFSSTTIKALPKELLMEVFARVASGSISDLCHVKLSCKEFLHASEHDYVCRHASLDKFPLVPLSWFTNDNEISFFKRCRKSGNPEVLHREVVVECFGNWNVKSALEDLKRAAQQGHNEAKYVYCMILMCSEDEEERKQGFDIFRFLRSSTCVIRRCRTRVKSFARNLWAKNHCVGQNRKSLCHCHPNACNVIRRSWKNLEDRGCGYHWWKILMFRVNIVGGITNYVCFVKCLESKKPLTLTNYWYKISLTAVYYKNLLQLITRIKNY